MLTVSLEADPLYRGYAPNYNGGVGGATMMPGPHGVPGEIAAILAAYPLATPAVTVLCDWGVNDITSGGGLPDSTAWKTAYLTTLDAIHAKWGSALVYLSKPWKTGVDAASDTMAGWIDDVVASRAFARAGDDERVWFKPNVATYSPDGTHYNAAGKAAKAQAIKAAMGY